MSLEFVKNEVKTFLGKLFSNDKINKVFNKLGLHPSLPKVLTFHRVLDPERLSYPIEDGMYVRPRTFEMLISYLVEEFELISIPELINRIERQRKLSNKTVILTFDDAWHDNYINAFPILKSLKIPATVFIPTSHVNTNNMFWTDKLIIHLPYFLSRGISHLKVTNPSAQKMIDSINTYSKNMTKRGNLEKLIEEFKNYDRDEIKNFIKELEMSNGDIYPEHRSFLNWDEIREMSNFNITFASHSHSHADLTKISREDLKLDIENSLEIMNKENIQFLKIFCYPGGYHNRLTQEVLNEFDFKVAFITAGSNDLSATPKILSRINIHDDVSKTKDLFRYTIGL